MDTNIFLDYWWDRGSGLKPTGILAKQFFDDTRACKYSFVISSFTLKEIELNFKRPDLVKEFLDGFDKLGKLRVVKVTQEVIDSAKRMRGVDEVPVHDRIHALMAKKEGAVLVTRDKHLGMLERIVQALAPEEL